MEVVNRISEDWISSAMWKQDGNHPWKWNSKSYFITLRDFSVSRQSPCWGDLLHVNKECTFVVSIDNFKTSKNGFPFIFLSLFLSQWSVSDALSLRWESVSQSEAITVYCWPMRGCWGLSVVSGSDRWIVSPVTEPGAGSGSDYYGDWGLERERLRHSVRTTLSRAQRRGQHGGWGGHSRPRKYRIIPC